MKISVVDFIKNHFDFKLYPVTWVAIVNLFLIVPCFLYLPEKYGYENGLLENIQLIVLAIGAYLAIKVARNNQNAGEKTTSGIRRFFWFVLMVLGILFLREINCGRTIFFPVPGTENSFYGWKDIKYGWLAHPLYGAYMAYVGFYFLYNKVFVTLWKMIKDVRVPVWNILLMLTGMAIGLFSEKVLNNMILEEITELLFYVSLVGIIYLYAFNKNFFIAEEASND